MDLVVVLYNGDNELNLVKKFAKPQHVVNEHKCRLVSFGIEIFLTDNGKSILEFSNFQ